MQLLQYNVISFLRFYQGRIAIYCSYGCIYKIKIICLKAYLVIMMTWGQRGYPAIKSATYYHNLTRKQINGLENWYIISPFQPYFNQKTPLCLLIIYYKHGCMYTQTCSKYIYYEKFYLSNLVSESRLKSGFRFLGT